MPPSQSPWSVEVTFQKKKVPVLIEITEKFLELIIQNYVKNLPI